MDVIVNEGETKQAQAADNLVFPNINSCLSFTLVAADGTRAGAHAVMYQVEGQADMLGIFNYLAQHPGNMLYVIGEIGVWDKDWAQLAAQEFATKTIVAEKDINSVEQFIRNLGYASKVIAYDTSNWTDAGGNGSYNISFLAAGKALTVVDGKEKSFTVPNHPTW